VLTGDTRARFGPVFYYAYDDKDFSLVDA